MKKIIGITFLVSLVLSSIVVANTASAVKSFGGKAQVGYLKRKTRKVAHRTKHGTKYVAHKTKRGTKAGFRKTKRGTKKTYSKTKDAVTN